MTATSDAGSYDTLEGLRTTIDLAPIGLAQFDITGRFLHVNDRLCEILGFDRRELTARTFQEVTFPEDLARCEQLTRQLAAGDLRNYCLDKRFVRGDGSVVWTRITVSAVRGSAGTPTFFIGAAEDISAQMTAVEALRVAEERLRASTDASMIATFRWDAQRGAMDWADGMDRVFGPGERASLEDYFAAMHPDDLPYVTAAYAKSVTDGADFEEEFRVIWPDGSIHWLHDRARIVRDATGRPHYIVGAITDITNHKRMEDIIAAREARFRTLANTIPQLAWIADVDGRRTWFNDRWLEFTGATLATMQGFGWMDVYESRASAEATLAGQRAAFAARRVWEGTVRLRRYDGEYRWFLSRAMPVQAQDGAVTEWFGTNTDITDRLADEGRREEMLRREQAARTAAERAIAARQQVLGFVAHDLRNPLQAILSAASAVLNLPLAPEQQTRRVELIKRCALEIERLITDLLDVSRIEAGTFAVRRGVVSLHTTIADTIDRCQPQAHARGVRLGATVAPDVPAVDGDSHRLAQVLSNLVTNALKFTDTGGTVHVTARALESGVVITVEDTGCGIAPEDLASIFDRFWQRDRTLGGAGLGLAIAKGIVEAHGGRITADSQPGRGTTFQVELPVSASAV